MFGGFLRAIALTYDEVIAPWWKEKAWKCRYNEKLAEKVKDYKFTEAKLSSMVAHYDKCEWASKDRRIWYFLKGASTIRINFLFLAFKEL